MKFSTRSAWRMTAFVMLAMLLCLPATGVWAATASASGAREGAFIAEIVVLLLVGRVLGEAMQRLGQPAITSWASAVGRAANFSSAPRRPRSSPNGRARFFSS